MALNFPNAPLDGDTYTGPGGIDWVWDGVKWVTGPGTGSGPSGNIEISAAGINDLPIGCTGNVLVTTHSDNPTPITVRLPPASFTGQEIYVKDIAGFATTQNIVVTTQNAEQIDNMLEYRIQYGFGGLGVTWAGSRWSIM